MQVVQSQTKDYNKTLDLKEKLVYALNVLCLGLILTRCLCKRTKKNQRCVVCVFHRLAFPPMAQCAPSRRVMAPRRVARGPCPAWQPSPSEIPVRKPETQEPQRRSWPGLRGCHVATVVGAPPWDVRRRLGDPFRPQEGASVLNTVTRPVTNLCCSLWKWLTSQPQTN